MHLDIFRELERSRAGTDQESFDLWRQEFNTQRPHEALGMAMPAENYRASKRAYEGTPEAIDYGTMETRKVNLHGTIGYGGTAILISTVFRHWNVGLSRRDDGRVDVWFAKLLVGHIDPGTASFKAISPPAKKHPSRRGVASLTAQAKPKKL